MQLFLVAALTLVNLLLWLVFFFKFKKLFTTENILNEFRAQMENLIKDVQHNTALNINLVDEKIRELKAAAAEAERRLSILRHELSSSKKSQAFLSEMDAQVQGAKEAEGISLSDRPKRAKAARPASKAPARGGAKSSAGRAADRYKQNELPAEDDTVALTNLFRENEQKTLFDSPEMTVTNDGDSYGKIPLVKPKILVSDNPIKPKKSFASRVRDLAELGQTVDEIAAATGRSTTEVQLVLDMN